MTDDALNDWQEENRRYLVARLALVRAALARHAARARAGASATDAPDTVAVEGANVVEGSAAQSNVVADFAESSGAPPDEELTREGGEAQTRESHAERTRESGEGRAHESPAALAVLCDALSLSSFERDVLLLCAGVELDASFARLCAEAQGDARRDYPTFSLALAALDEAHWSALSPASPLRYWRLVEVDAGRDALTQARLRIDERVLHHLTGITYLDERLRGLVEPVETPSELPPSHRELAHRLAESWAGEERGQALPVVSLSGADASGRRAVAAAASAMLGRRLYALHSADVPQGVGEREALARLWERESVLQEGALLVEVGEGEGAHAVVSFVESVGVMLFVSARESLRLRARRSLSAEVRKPSAAEQQQLWQNALGPLAHELNGQLETLVSHFNLSADAIRAAGAQALAAAGREEMGEVLWSACRVRGRARLDDLAQRIEPAAGWGELVLPEYQLRMLREIAAHVRRRGVVYESWGFAARGGRGLGISALFAGSSGTGKTMAAEVLAGDLRLDLYRIDLSQVVSKYIGETEKNLRRVFDAAEESGAVLLFDEADALFGKRSEVKDSHDRYANIEVSYLLQRMESYRGLAILTTNLKTALDTAFMRRLRFVVHFPFPDAAQRAEIWRRVFPPGTPTEGLDYEKLSRLSVAGGHIRNIALHAAFLAADEGAGVSMAHILRAARGEYEKMERPLTEAESGGWL
ncbi:MAG TPA: ATP-binding protein [Pyrinomonadaceae bacterium]|nr:ATP-binding protein [Pyrinomonadaceae bacterium]